jgi:hypothetical protein
MLCDPTPIYSLPDSSWLSLSNDSLFLASDDGYTAGASAHLHGKGWTATVGYRMLTDRPTGGRADQAGLVFGVTNTVSKWYVEPSAGIALVGNLGGARVQARWHRSKHIAELPCRYDTTTHPEPVASLRVRYGGDHLGIEAVGGIVGRSAFLEPSIGTGGEAAVLRAGWRMAWGYDDSHTVRRVLADECGPFVSLGLNAGLCSSFAFGAHAAYWSVGASW